MKGKIVGVISIKGGVGKTTSVANLGAVFASDFEKKVLLVDANYSSPSLGLHLGVVNPEKTVNDVLLGKAKAEKAIYEHEFGFHIMPASLLQKDVDPFVLRKKIKHLKQKYDVILVDSSPNLNSEMLSTMVAADELLVVTTADYPTLSATMHAVKIAKQKKTPIVGLILNGLRGKDFELRIEDIEEATGVPVLAVLPDDTKVLEALAETTPASMHAPTRDISVEYKKLAASLIGENYDDLRFKSRFKKVFSRQIPKQEINRTVLKENR